MPYLMSAPIVLRFARSYPVALPPPSSCDWEMLFSTVYGVTSRRRGAVRPANPDTSANCETRPPFDLRNTGHARRSPERPTLRMNIMPKVGEPLGGKRSWLSGIRNSAVQPSASHSTRAPSIRTSPEVGTRMPLSSFTVVDLPAPFGPT